jgi:hypothetical protein
MVENTNISFAGATQWIRKCKVPQHRDVVVWMMANDPIQPQIMLSLWDPINDFLIIIMIFICSQKTEKVCMQWNLYVLLSLASHNHIWFWDCRRRDPFEGKCRLAAIVSQGCLPHSPGFQLERIQRRTSNHCAAITEILYVLNRDRERLLLFATVELSNGACRCMRLCVSISLPEHWARSKRRSRSRLETHSLLILDHFFRVGILDRESPDSQEQLFFG